VADGVAEGRPELRSAVRRPVHEGEGEVDGQRDALVSEHLSGGLDRDLPLERLQHRLDADQVSSGPHQRADLGDYRRHHLVVGCRLANEFAGGSHVAAHEDRAVSSPNDVAQQPHSGLVEAVGGLGPDVKLSEPERCAVEGVGEDQVSSGVHLGLV
jgi:hypothetical protein